MFTDKAGNQWDLEITIGTAMRLAEIGFDLVDGDVMTLVNDLMLKPTLRLKVIWTICSDQALELEMKELDFWNQMGTVQIKAMTDELKDSFINFMQVHRNESDSDMQDAISKCGQLLRKQTEMQMAMLNNPEIHKKLDQMGQEVMDKALDELGKMSIDLPELQVAGPKTTHSGN